MSSRNNNVQRKVQCPGGCHGGRITSIGYSETCHSCAGTGRDLKEDLYAGYCRTCNGRGKVQRPSQTCNVCNGRGYVYR